MYACSVLRSPVYALDRFVEDGFGRLCIAPGGETKIDQLAIRIDRSPEIAPFTANSDLGFIYMPIEACSAHVLLGALGRFRGEFLDPAIHGRPINLDPMLCQKIDHILVGQRISQIPTNSA